MNSIHGFSFGFGWVHGSLLEELNLHLSVIPACATTTNGTKSEICFYYYSILYLLDLYPDLCFDHQLEQTLKYVVSDPVMS